MNEPTRSKGAPIKLRLIHLGFENQKRWNLVVRLRVFGVGPYGYLDGCTAQV